LPFLWTYLIGPVLAFLPRRWQQAERGGGIPKDPSEPEEGGVGGSQGGACRWGVLPPGGGRSQEGDTAILVPLEEIDSGGAREECDFLWHSRGEVKWEVSQRFLRVPFDGPAKFFLFY
jgi:hypothetical protein